MKSKLIIAIAIAVAFGSIGLSTEPQSSSTSTPTAGREMHRQMMPIHARLIEEQKAQDSEIDKLLAEVQAASGEKRIDAIVAVLKKLIEQRKAMNAEIAAHLDR